MSDARQRRAPELSALRAATRRHERAFRASQAAHNERNRAIIAARNAGYSWEEITVANGADPQRENVTRTSAYALWRSGKYGPIPDEALTVHERRRRAREQTP